MIKVILSLSAAIFARVGRAYRLSEDLIVWIFTRNGDIIVGKNKNLYLCTLK